MQPPDRVGIGAGLDEDVVLGDRRAVELEQHRDLAARHDLLLRLDAARARVEQEQAGSTSVGHGGHDDAVGDVGGGDRRLRSFEAPRVALPGGDGRERRRIV